SRSSSQDASSPIADRANARRGGAAKAHARDVHGSVHGPCVPPALGAQLQAMTVLGTLLGGRYRLDSQIGRGGMSTVYLAFDSVLERPVAIKLMHREIASDSNQLERFRREARSVAQLSHPHIVTVIDAGGESSPDGRHPDGGAPYIVFEYVEGDTLKDLIRREGPLDIPQAIAYAIQIARALGAAHEH